jgi:hypothetical protein
MIKLGNYERPGGWQAGKMDQGEKEAPAAEDLEKVECGAGLVGTSKYCVLSPASAHCMKMKTSVNSAADWALTGPGREHNRGNGRRSPIMVNQAGRSRTGAPG